MSTTKLVRDKGIEPLLSGCRPESLPLQQSRILAESAGLEPTIIAFKAQCNTLCYDSILKCQSQRSITRLEGFEPNRCDL